MLPPTFFLSPVVVLFFLLPYWEQGSTCCLDVCTLTEFLCCVSMMGYSVEVVRRLTAYSYSYIFSFFLLPIYLTFDDYIQRYIVDQYPNFSPALQTA